MSFNLSFLTLILNFFWKMVIFLSSQIPHWNYSQLGHILRTLKQFQIHHKLNNRCYNLIRHITSKNEGNIFLPFLDMLHMRQNEAKRSILVQVQSSGSYKELHSYCSSIGTVKEMLHYSVGVEPMNFIIVEFANESDITNVLAAASHVDDTQVVPVKSQFLWFKATNRKMNKLKASNSATLTVENGTKAMKESDLRKLLTKCDSISEQMMTLYSETRLNDLGSRLRFLTARQVELALKGMFPQALAFPFGSSVNGCGKMGCDLDLVLRLTKDDKSDDSRLVFHCKATSGSDRATSQRNMEMIGDLIQLFLPGCSQVRKILQARVPIIKYYQQLTEVECDLSMTNMSGVHMSDFLYIMGSLDHRVRPLIFTIRKWANDVGLTNSSPGRWITNFSLTLLVLAFLQKPLRSLPILPSFNTLVKSSGPKDKYVTEDGINCTFLRDVQKLKNQTKNLESLESLLMEFFEFYSQFDFETKAICLNEAVTITKPEHCALYIVNPLERGLNVSKNVSFEELDRFKTECRNAAWILESQENKNENWGLLSIYVNKMKNNYSASLTSKQRLMEVSTLFTEENTMEFHNNNVKKQVEQIKRETKEKIHKIEKLSSR